MKPIAISSLRCSMRKMALGFPIPLGGSMHVPLHALEAWSAPRLARSAHTAVRVSLGIVLGSGAALLTACGDSTGPPPPSPAAENPAFVVGGTAARRPLRERRRPAAQRRRRRLVRLLLGDAGPPERRPHGRPLHGLPGRGGGGRVRPRRPADLVRSGRRRSVLDGRPHRRASGLVHEAGAVPRQLEAALPGASGRGHQARLPGRSGRRHHAGAHRRSDVPGRAQPHWRDVHRRGIRRRCVHHREHVRQPSGRVRRRHPELPGRLGDHDARRVPGSVPEDHAEHVLRRLGRPALPRGHARRNQHLDVQPAVLGAELRVPRRLAGSAELPSRRTSK